MASIRTVTGSAAGGSVASAGGGVAAGAQLAALIISTRAVMTTNKRDRDFIFFYSFSSFSDLVFNLPDSS
jgi:hypothetical protein